MSRCIQQFRTLGRASRRAQYCVPLMDFLYETATIHRYYSDNRRGDAERASGNPFAEQDDSNPFTRRDTDQQSDRGLYKSGGTYGTSSRDSSATHRASRSGYPGRESRYRSDPEPYGGPRRRRYPDDDVARTSDKDMMTNPWTGRLTSHSKSQTFNRSKASTPLEHVPFDSPGDAAKLAVPDASTLSNQERKAFDRLRRLGALKPSTVGNDIRTRNGEPETIEDLLEEAMSNIEASRESEEGREAGQSVENVSKRDMALHNMRKSEAKRISDLFKRAPTDMALWSLLEKDVFGPIDTLKLDQPTDERSSTKREKRKSSAKIQPKDKDVIMHNFPLLLTGACRTLRALFPTSVLVFAVVPKIRDMGPSAYALGASTKLYNQVLAHTFNKLVDVDRVNELLEEMEQEAIEPDAVTLVLLNNIMSTWQKVRRGMYGEAARVTWETDRFKRALATLAKSTSQIETTVSMKETGRAAREQKASQASDGGSDVGNAYFHESV